MDAVDDDMAWPNGRRYDAFATGSVRAWRTVFDGETYTCIGFEHPFDAGYTVEFRRTRKDGTYPYYTILATAQTEDKDAAQAKVEDILLRLPVYLTEAML